jgi:DNA repair protein RecO (recombination protein O)
LLTLRNAHRENARGRQRNVVLPGVSAGWDRPVALLDLLWMAGRTYKTEAVVLRSFRFGEADCVLHLYTLDRGRVGALAKGIRRTKSRFGARLEPLSYVETLLHQGRGELQTVTGVELIDPHRPAREDPYRLAVGLVGIEATLRLFTEQEANARAFRALTRFLELLDGIESGRATRPALDPLALSFQLKLLWLAGYLPHVTSCAECGADEPLVAFSPKAGGALCTTCSNGAIALSRTGLAGVEALLRLPLAEAARAGLTERGARDALAIVAASHEFHGGFRLRTLAAS